MSLPTNQPLTVRQARAALKSKRIQSVYVSSVLIHTEDRQYVRASKQAVLDMLADWPPYRRTTAEVAESDPSSMYFD